ncbi:MAG: BUG/TctC family periplasmic protein, partial [uncultured Acetobacteraceae bacterium]
DGGGPAGAAAARARRRRQSTVHSGRRALGGPARGAHRGGGRPSRRGVRDLVRAARARRNIARADTDAAASRRRGAGGRGNPPRAAGAGRKLGREHARGVRGLPARRNREVGRSRPRRPDPDGL